MFLHNTEHDVDDIHWNEIHLQISNCREKERLSKDLLSTVSPEKDAVDISIIIMKEGAIPDVDIKRALIPKFHMLFRSHIFLVCCMVCLIWRNFQINMNWRISVQSTEFELPKHSHPAHCVSEIKVSHHWFQHQPQHAGHATFWHASWYSYSNQARMTETGVDHGTFDYLLQKVQ